MNRSADRSVAAVAFLKTMPLFDGLSESELSVVAEALRWRRYKRGEAIYRQEDPPGSLYLVMSGLLKVCLETPTGRQFTTNWIKPGSFFGLISVLDDHARLSDAISIETSEMFVWPREDFLKFLELHPDKCLYLLMLTANRWRSTMSRLYDLAFLDVPGRTAKALLMLAEQIAPSTTITNITHSELGALIGTSRESTSRWIRTFEESGLIRTGKGTIEILDEAGLRSRIKS